MNNWEKERLAEQLKFFGAKKTKFISVYAKKPRIVCKAKVTSTPMQYGSERYLGNLYQDQLNRGVQNSQFGFLQMSAARDAHLQAMSQTANLGLSGLMGIGQAAKGVGGLCGIGGLGVHRQ